jgi:hypothetical protein
MIFEVYFLFRNRKIDPNHFSIPGVLKQILRNVTLPVVYMVYGLEGDRPANAMYHPS